MARRRSLVAVAAALLGVAGCGIVGDPFGPTGPIDTDPSAMAQWRSVLGPALADLDAISSPSGFTADRASVRPCSEDEGERFSINAGRVWTMPGWDGATGDDGVRSRPTYRALRSIVEQLQARGWKLVDTHRYNASETVGVYDAVDLERRYGPRLVRLGLQGLTGWVNADLDFRTAPEGCSGTSSE